MLKFKYITKCLNSLFIIFVITSCAVNDKKAFNIIDEAKKIFLNISNDTEKKKNKNFNKKNEIVKEKKIQKIKKEKVLSNKENIYRN